MENNKKKRADLVDREVRYDVTPHGIAINLLMQHGNRLLVVRSNQRSHSDLLVVDETGVWSRSDEILHRWMVDRGETLRREAMDEQMGDKEMMGLLRSIRSLFDPHRVGRVRKMAAASLAVLREGINADAGGDFGVAVCLDTELDSDLRYIGTESGVVDLDTGDLLSPDEGRKHLITHRAPVKWDADATHPDVDRLLAHLPPDEREWCWDVFGYALRGSPSARIYEVIGPPRAGKSGLLAAIAATLGPYAGVPPAELLEYHRGAGNGTGLSPGIVAMVPPRRFALFDEVKPARLNHKMMKDWSGDGAGVTWQPKYRDPRTDPVTATMFLFCNTGQEARLGLQDAGMRRRLRTLRFPALPPDDVIEEFNTVRIRDPGFQTALLARLVKAASAGKTGSPPAAPPSVMASTTERIADDVGEIGRFARRVVRGGEVLTVAKVWHAWCEHNDEASAEVTAAGGIPHQRISTVLRDHVDGLSSPKQIRIKGKNHRGWRNWRLLTVEELEGQGHPDSPITTEESQDRPARPPITTKTVFRLEPSVRSHVIASRIVDEARRRLADAEVDSGLLAAKVGRMLQDLTFALNESQWDGGIPPVERTAILIAGPQQVEAAIPILLLTDAPSRRPSAKGTEGE